MQNVGVFTDVFCICSYTVQSVDRNSLMLTDHC